MHRPTPQPLAALAMLAFAVPVAAQVTQRLPCATAVPCHQLLVVVQLAGHSTELTLQFEQVENLTTSSFAITADPVQPDDPTVAARLPNGVFVNSILPLHFTIERAPNSTVRFHGQWTLELHTEVFDFEGETPTARLFRAHAGGAFSDATFSVGVGSYRVRGASGDFSEFLLVDDLRPPQQIAFAKYQELQAAIAAGVEGGEIDAASATSLSADTQHSHDAFAVGDRADALAQLDQLADDVVSRSGTGVADVWDPAKGKVSRAGILRGLAAGARVSVELATRAKSAATASFVRHLTTAAGHQLDVIVSFPNQVGDLAAGLDISASDVDPSDRALLARLPLGVSIPRSFPVLLHVGPLQTTAALRPAFRGAWEIDLRTRELDFAAGTPLRLFKAPDGNSSTFADISSSLAIDSYRVRGASGDFSQFLVVSDSRSPTTVINGKFDHLAAELATFAPQIAPDLLSELDSQLATARADAQSTKKLRTAIAVLDDMAAEIDAASGVELPDVFRHGDPRTNVAGVLTGGIRSLQLSLSLRLGTRGHAPPAPGG